MSDTSKPNSPDDTDSSQNDLVITTPLKKNQTRFEKLRLQISSSRYNQDVQGVAIELRKKSEEQRKVFSLTNELSDLVRDGCRYRVIYHPEETTSWMHYIFDNTLSPGALKRATQGDAEGAGLIPLMTQYHRKRLKGRSIPSRYYAKLISAQDVINMHHSASKVFDDIMDNHLLRRIIEEHKQILYDED